MQTWLSFDGPVGRPLGRPLDRLIIAQMFLSAQGIEMLFCDFMSISIDTISTSL